MFEYFWKGAKMLDYEDKLSIASRAVAITRCLSLMASILVGSTQYHPVHGNDNSVRPERDTQRSHR